jgi:hypothetical protein
MNHCYMNHSFAIGREVFIVPGQAPVAAQPCKRPLHHPTFGQHHKASNPDGTQDCLEEPATRLFDPADQLPCISAISPDDLQARERASHFLQQGFGAIAILNVCRMHEHSQNQTQCVDQQMAFATGDFFSPRRSRVRRLDPWSSPIGYPRQPHSARGRDHRGREPCPVSCHGRAARCRPGTNAGNSRTPIPRAGNRAATCAKSSRCTRHKEHPEPIRDYYIDGVARPIWIWAAETDVQYCPTEDQ